MVAAAEGRRVSPGEIDACFADDVSDVRRALLSAQFAAASPAAEMTPTIKRRGAARTESRTSLRGHPVCDGRRAVAAVATELIARVDPRVAAAESLAPAGALKAAMGARSDKERARGARRGAAGGGGGRAQARGGCRRRRRRQG